MYLHCVGVISINLEEKKSAKDWKINDFRILLAKNIKDEPDQTIRYLKSVYEQEPINEKYKALIWEELAYTVEKLNLKSTEIRIQKNILKFNRTSTRTWRRIIDLFVERKKYGRAREVCQEASNVFPNELWCLREQIYINQRYLGNDTETVEICRKILNDHQYDYDFSDYFFEKMLEIDSTNQATQNWIRTYLDNKEKYIEDLYNYNPELLFNGIKNPRMDYTYFLLAEQTNLMKSGKSKTPHERIKNIQGNSPEKLKIIAYVKGNFEKELHAQFEQYRIHGEWFEPTKEILYTIIKLLMHEIYSV